MKHSLVKFPLVALALLTQCFSASATEPARLSHNPFSRPPSVVTAPDRSALRTDGPVQMPELRATMVSSNDRLANVAGKTLRPGDEIQGYTLLQVFEDHAVFTRGDRRLTVYVKPDPEEDAK